MDYRDKKRGVHMLLPEIYHVRYCVELLIKEEGKPHHHQCEFGIYAHSDEEAIYVLKQIKETGKIVSKSSFNHPDFVIRN